MEELNLSHESHSHDPKFDQIEWNVKQLAEEIITYIAIILCVCVCVRVCEIFSLISVFFCLFKFSIHQQQNWSRDYCHQNVQIGDDVIRLESSGYQNKLNECLEA